MRSSFAFLLTLTLASVCFAADVMPAKTKPTIKIGLIMPLSGNSSNFGENGRDGILLRIHELNADAKFNYQLIVEDDGFESARTNLAAQKLRSVDQVDVIVSMWGQASSVIVPRLVGSSIINMSADRWGNPFKEMYPYDFIVGPNVELYTAKMITALKALGVKRIAIFSSAMQGILAYDKIFKEELKKEKIDLVFYTMLPDNVRDFRTAILQAREAKPDLVLNDLIAPQTEILLKQMREINFKPMVACPSAMLLDVDPTLSAGTFYTLNATPDEGFTSRFHSYFARDPKYPAAFSYDAASLVINAAEKLPANKKPTPERIAEELKQTKDFPAALGRMSFQAPNLISSPVSYFIFRDGKPVEISLEDLVKYYKTQK